MRKTGGCLVRATHKMAIKSDVLGNLHYSVRDVHNLVKIQSDVNNYLLHIGCITF